MTAKSTDVLAAEIEAMAKEIAELKGLFTAFQNNFVRMDIYAVRHEEVVAKVAKLEKDSVAFDNAINQAMGAIRILKGSGALLTGVAAVLGALLWWKIG